MNSPQPLFASAPKGIASLLFSELSTLGATELKEQPAGVKFHGTLETAYRVALWSRTASRLLLPLADFYAPTPEALYAGVQAIDWAENLMPDGPLVVDANTSHSKITHSHYAALKVKDAIVDQFRELCGVRPSVDTNNPDLRINLHLHRDQATISIDLSGDSLHRRGYRRESVAAPLKENLAAAILLRGGWPAIYQAGGPLLDPMCGSGTLLIEAALMAGDIAPGLLRKQFGFLRWKRHDAALWEQLLSEAQERRTAGVATLPTLIGYDNERRAVRAALANVEAAGLHGKIHIECRDATTLTPPATQQPGLIVINPPYGERLGETETLGTLYATLGRQMKQHFVGWQAALFTGNPDLAKQLGIRAKKIYPLYNGPLECKLLRIDLQPERFMERPVIRGGITMPKAANLDALSPGAQMFANRLRKNLKELKRWAHREAISCYRLYDADMPEYALAIDLYHEAETEQRWVHLQEYEAPKSIDPEKSAGRLREALSALPEVLEIPMERLYLKVRRRQKGKAQYEKQATEQQFFEVREGDCKFLINLADYLDSGLFLDHRLTRAKVGELADGQRMLNLFAYTGSATVHAAQGGAKSTTTIDMSRTYLNWARRNMALNDFVGEEHDYIQADCLEWLEQQTQSPWTQRFGLIFLDPPTFSTSKRMEQSFDIQRDHVALIQRTIRLLDKGGTLIFSNNFRRFQMDREALAELTIEEISRATLPKDFARHPRIHNCWRITHGSSADSM